MSNVMKLIASLSNFVNKNIVFVEHTFETDKLKYLVYDEITNILYFTDSAITLLQREDINAQECEIYNIEGD